jgi:DNA-binding NarL/FixJ family response regulator
MFLSHNNHLEIVHAAHIVGASAYVHKRKAARDLLRAIAVAVGRGKNFIPVLYTGFQRTRVNVRS